MKLLIVLALVALALARPDHYDSKLDNFNADEIISNIRLLRAFTHCLLGDGKCTSEGNDIKARVPEALSETCAKCTEKQKILTAKIINAIITQLPAEYEALSKKNDPDNKYGANVEEFLAKYSS